MLLSKNLVVDNNGATQEIMLPTCHMTARVSYKQKYISKVLYRAQDEDLHIRSDHT